MGKQRGIPTGVWIFAAAVVVAKIGDAPAGVWILIGVLAFIYWLIRSSKVKSMATAQPQQMATQWQLPVNQSSEVIVNAAKEQQKSYPIPAPPKNGNMSGRWLSERESIEVAGISIPGGLVYVGSSLKAASGDIEPALIDPAKPVSRNKGDFTERLTGYWASYSNSSPEARRAYLLWLADGKKHPEADIGYVFLYFYGLERRVVFDAQKDAAAEADKPAIAAELRRLLSIYGKQPNSFKGYARRLLEFIELSEIPGKRYSQPLPELEYSYELPYPLRLALGQTAVDGVAVPAHLALAWAEHEPTISKRTPVTRCAEEFKKLFVLKYQKKYGEGLKLTVNRTKLKLSYTPASAGLRGFSGGINLHFGDIPDVSALTGPPKKLQAVVEECAAELNAYSRFLGRSPEKKDSLEAILLLPVALWSDTARNTLSKLKKRVINDVQVMTLLELSQIFNGTEAPNRERLLGLAKALEGEHICMEPDVLAGAKTPKPEEKLVLFHGDTTTVESRSTPAYQSALVTLELAAGVAAADGDFSAAELDHINASIDKWQHLTPSSQRRLRARVRLLMVAPVSLAALKKKVEPLDSATKEAIASFTATLVQADGVVSPDEIKFLEKVYKLLGVDIKKVYSDVHQAVTTESTQDTPVITGASTFKLDSARIAALQQDSAKVAALLSGIFVEDEPVAVPAAVVPVEVEDVPTDAHILGLDESHSAFVRLLMSRPSWARDELNNVALDLDLMLDGALERVNEVALDTFDISFTEGDDPIEVNPEINEKVIQ
jgi:uncharacterized tellurite resistance protein B-like protein